MDKRVIWVVALGGLLLTVGYGLNQRFSQAGIPGTPGSPQAKSQVPTAQHVSPQVTTPPTVQMAPKPGAVKPQPKPKSRPSAGAPRAILNLPTPPTPSTKASPADIAQVERMVMDLVNQDRKRFGLAPVTWDKTAARAARQHVQEEADYGYISHWGLDGAKPQLRYSRVGGRDVVDENESVTLWLQGGFRGVSRDQLLSIVTQHEEMMLNEQPPNDGHRKNILDPHHTGVGIAIAIGKYGVAMAQEFTNHYAELNPPPLTAPAGSEVTLSGHIFPGYQITGVYAVWEQLPQPMTKDQLMQTRSYGDPPWDNLYFWAKPNGEGYYIPTESGNIPAANLKVDAEGDFSLHVPLSNKACLDYITLEIAPQSNSNERFYAGQFVVQH